MCKHQVRLILFGLFYLSSELMLECHSSDPVVETAISKDKNVQKPRADWIDPFDMSVDPSSIGWKNLDHAHENIYTNSKSRTSETFIIYQRFVNIFLRAMALKDAPEIIGSKVVQLDLVINGRDLEVLQGFGINGAKGANVDKVSEILNKIFLESQLRSSSLGMSLSKILQWLGNALSKLISSPEWTITTSLLSMVIAILWLVFVTRSFRLALFCAFFMIFIAGFGFTWMRMYEEQEIERYYGQLVHGDAPYHCKGRTLTWYETIYYYWFGEDCLKFYKTRDVRPIVKVSPTEVLSVTVSTMFIEPARNIAKAYGCFVCEVVGHMPWYLKPLAVPLAFIVPPVFLILILAFFFNYRFSFSITGFHLIPSWSRPVSYRQDEKYIEDLSNRANVSCQSNNVLETTLSNCKNPLVLMNLSAVKSIFSSSSNKDLVDNNKSNEGPNVPESQSEEAVEECLEDVSKSKCESCKKRTKSIYTSVSGSSSSSSGDAMMTLSGGDGDQNCIPQTDIDKYVHVNKSKTS